MSKFTRREFLKTGGLALAGLTIAPSSILGKSHGHVPPSDRLNIAAVGIGGMGHTNINHVKAGATRKVCSMSFPMRRSIGTIVRCTMRWVRTSMPLSSLLPTIHMPSLLLMP